MAFPRGWAGEADLTARDLDSPNMFNRCASLVEQNRMPPAESMEMVHAANNRNLVSQGQVFKTDSAVMTLFFWTCLSPVTLQRVL
jgi:hypothetical protein